MLAYRQLPASTGRLLLLQLVLSLEGAKDDIGSYADGDLALSSPPEFRAENPAARPLPSIPPHFLPGLLLGSQRYQERGSPPLSSPLRQVRLGTLGPEALYTAEAPLSSTESTLGTSQRLPSPLAVHYLREGLQGGGFPLRLPYTTLSLRDVLEAASWRSESTFITTPCATPGAPAQKICLTSPCNGQSRSRRLHGQADHRRRFLPSSNL